MARNYKLEYKNYHSKPEQKKRRANRNAARDIMEKKGLVKKGDKKDVDHKDRNTKNNKSSNLRVTSRAKNRSRNGTKKK
tara:strand:+ start:58 stop:294 length:237 start_codon:yes stop_codon:yes gene_type:complete